MQELASLETQEIGKPIKETLFVDIPMGAEDFKFYANLLETLEERLIKTPTGISLLEYEPLGVCVIYLPYNVPLMILGFVASAALAGGNSVIIKPSEYGSLSVLAWARYLEKLDLPRGLINVITGKGESVGRFLAQSQTDLISFTGSRDTFKKIFSNAASWPKKMLCELGGANLTLVFKDADLREALDNVLSSSFIKQGQMCIGTSLLLVEEEIYEDFIKDLIDKVKKLKLADPLLPDTHVGPLPTKSHLENVHLRVKNLVENGARILSGGEILEDKFYPPTVIEIKELLYEEFFAPVILTRPFKKEEALQMVLKNPAGLVLQIWTKDFEFAYGLAKSCCAGTVWINTFAQMGPQTPFGGFKLSGWGRNLGRWGFFEYVQPKHIGLGLGRSQTSGWFGV